MALANVNNQKRQVLSGLLVNRPVSAIFYGDVYYATDNGLWYIYTPSGWVVESLPAIVATIAASENFLGAVGGSTLNVEVTPAITAGAYSINDFIGGLMTIPGALRIAGKQAILQDINLIDAAKQNAPLDIFIFKSTPAGAYADNAAESITDADALLCIKRLSIGAADYKTFANFSQATLTSLGLTVFATTGTSLYALARVTTAPTYVSVADLKFTFGFLRD